MLIGIGLCLLAAPALAVEPAMQTPREAVLTDSAGMPGDVRRLLEAEDDTAVTFPKIDRDAVRDFYAARAYRPVWMWEKGLNTRAMRLMRQIATAAEDGLRAADYLPPSLMSFTDDAGGLAHDVARLARIELEVTRGALAYARHVSGGRVAPASLSRSMAIVPATVDSRVALDALAGTLRPDRYLAGLLPTYEGYRVLKAALADHRARIGSRSWTPIPAGPLIRPGDDDGRVIEIRRRLIDLGHYAINVSEENALRSDDRIATEAALLSTRYDDRLVDALRHFQRTRHLAPDGIVGPTTVSALNHTDRNALDKILINMERMRWLPRDLGRRHIVVNQAAFRLRLYDDREIVHTARVIIGKRGHSTPVFSDEVERIVFNPYWNVPRSIATKEMLPRLAQDPTFLARQGYEVFHNDGRRTQRVDSSRVDWWNTDPANFSFSIRQPPGRSNALGRIKFLFPNRYNIYLHDTPSKRLFERSSRAFSHGCIRLQHPERLAEILLDWDKDWSPAAIARKLASGRNQGIDLDRRIPIYLSYFTAGMGDDGQVEYYQDVYGRDAALARALAEVRVALK